MPQVQKSAIVESKSEMPDHNNSISKLEIEMPPHVKKPAELGFIQKIEPIQEELFGLNNEYWLSFYNNSVMYDKKFVFLAESVQNDHLINIPIINKPGVMIK